MIPSPCNSEDIEAFLSGELSVEDTTRLEEHVDTCSECRILIGALGRESARESARALAATTVPMADAEPELAAPVRMGERVGRYVIVDWLGEGGMGVVYAAHDPELDRTVALKLLRAGASDTGVDHGERLLREARAMARVGHPNVVAVFDTGFHGERIFIAMERVDGTTLREWLRAAPRSWQEIVRVYIEAGRGLAAAHAAGLVHRDFKPENVLIGTDGRVRVTDFGLARADGPGPASQNARRDFVEIHASIAFGTPAYMSPEQLRFELADARSDQFAFAVALFEGLHGERPFDGTTLPTLCENIMAGRIGDFPKGHRAPQWLRRAVLRALRGERDERYPSMDALLTALGHNPYARWRSRAVLAGWVVALGVGAWGVKNMYAAPEPRCQDAGQKLAGVWDDARKAAVHDAFVGTGVPYAEPTFLAVRDSLDAYAREWTRGRIDACEATWVRGEQSAERLDLRMACLDQRLNEAHVLVDVYARADAKTVQNASGAARSLTMPAQCNDAKYLGLAVAPPPDPGKAARVDAVRNRLAEMKALRDSGHPKDAMAMAEWAVTEALAIGYGPIESLALLRHAELLSIVGVPPKDAEAALYQAAWAADRAHDDDSRAEAWVRLLLVVGTREQHVAEIPMLNAQAVAAIARAGGPADLEYLRRHILASVYRTQGRSSEARTELEAAMVIAEKHFGPDSRQIAALRLDLGRNRMALGQYPAAQEQLERALLAMERALGPGHPDVGIVLDSVGTVLAKQGKLAEAEALERRAVALLDANYGPVHTDLAAFLDNTGDVLRREKKYAEALAMHTRALAMHEQLYGPEHPELALSLLGMGHTHLDMGDPTAARPLLERAFRLSAKDTDPASRAEIQFVLAEALEPRARRRARDLATAARDTYRADAAANAEALQEAERWLTTHP